MFVYFIATPPPHRPTPALVACRCRPLPSVCSIVCRLIASLRRQTPPVQQHRRRHWHCVLLLPPRSLIARRSSRRTLPALAAANRRSSSSRTTPLLLSSVFSFAPSSALSTMRFDGVPSAPGLSAPPPGPKKLSSSPLEVVVDCLATNPTGGDSDRRMLGRSTAVRWSGQRTSSPPHHHPPTRSFVPLSRRRSSPTGQRGRWRWSTPHHCRSSGGRQLLPSFSLRLHGQYDVAPPPANEVSLSSSSPTSCHRHRCACQMLEI